MEVHESVKRVVRGVGVGPAEAACRGKGHWRRRGNENAGLQESKQRMVLADSRAGLSGGSRLLMKWQCR